MTLYINGALSATVGGGTASTAAAGTIELATQAEVDAATDAVRAVTPATLEAAANVIHSDYDEIKTGMLTLQCDGASGISADAAADCLVIDTDQTNAGLSILSAAGGNQNIYFGEAGNSTKAAHIQYIGSTNVLRLGTANINRLTANGTGIDILGQLDVDQSSTTGAVPVLYLDQADVSEEFIRFDAVEATGNPVEDVAAKTLTVTKFVRVNVNGTDLYLQAGTIA